MYPVFGCVPFCSDAPVRCLCKRRNTKGILFFELVHTLLKGTRWNQSIDVPTFGVPHIAAGMRVGQRGHFAGAHIAFLFDVIHGGLARRRHGSLHCKPSQEVVCVFLRECALGMNVHDTRSVANSTVSEKFLQGIHFVSNLLVSGHVECGHGLTIKKYPDIVMAIQCGQLFLDDIHGECRVACIVDIEKDGDRFVVHLLLISLELFFS